MLFSEVLTGIKQNYAARPEKCRMQHGGDFIFDCDTCEVYINLDH